jgi:hypothetical protein
VTRTVGVTLRGTLGRAAILALGLGAISSAPHGPVPVTVAEASLPPLPSPIDEVDEPVPRQARAAVLISVEPRATPPESRVVGPLWGAGSNFAYGYCTWWVAHKRDIPWQGNAAQWWWNARPFGFVEGATPRVGAILVMGYSATTPGGHVAYVESVNPNGSFVVSEMNWWGVPGGGWDRVDYRTVTSMANVLGFIY